MPHVLITTLGTSWQIVPELFGFTNPKDLDLYRYHPQACRISQSRARYNISPVQEIWAITTQGEFADSTIQSLLDWHKRLQLLEKPQLRIWQVKGTRDLGSEDECKLMGEGIFRLVLTGVREHGRNRVCLSLAGGRKTMSSDMQRAATVFGCKVLLHVIDNGRSLSRLKDLQSEDFIKPLPQELEDAVTPLVVGKEDAEVSRLGIGQELIQDDRYYSLMPLAQNRSYRQVAVSEHLSLQDEIEKRSRQAEFLLSNYTTRMLKGQENNNFLALYLLPNELIDRLKKVKLGLDQTVRDQELDWLRRLPKAELHCHLGGIADSSELVEIAQANAEEIDKYKDCLNPWLSKLKAKIEQNKLVLTPKFCKDLRRSVPEVPEPLCVAAFILCFQDCPEYLDELIFGRYMNAENFCGVGFKVYEVLGELQGSGLLQSKASLQAACRILIRRSRAENIRYLELRCSPLNYTRAGLSAEEVVQIIDRELSAQDDFEYSLIFIASRHGKMSTVYQHVELAEELLEQDEVPSLRGFDLAGSEKTGSIEQLRQAFMPMLRQCRHITIHAGETEQVDRIWEAVYHLSAERIGHGLTLKDNTDLMEKFKDRNIAVEMCPSSNFQIVGFQDNYYPETRNQPAYPLQDYLEKGLKVAVCTDNPGISRTDFTNELHRAARLSLGGLSHWDICQILRNSFKSGFAPRGVRNRLLRNAEEELIDLLKQLDF